MLTFWGQGEKYCDHVSRRNFLRAGALGLGGLGVGELALPDLLRRQALAASSAPRAKSIIYICLGGGPSQIDTWDMKPEAPAEYRGEFSPIATRIPGIQICELMPRQAALIDRLAIVRGIKSVENDHFLAEVYTGFPKNVRKPAFGSVVSRLLAAARPAGEPPCELPAYVSLMQEEGSIFEFENAEYAGAAHRPFRPYGDAVSNLAPVEGLTLDRLGDRRRLLRDLDLVARAANAASEAAGYDAFQRQAMEMIASRRVRDAFDVSQEPAELLERYGQGMPFLYNKIEYQWDVKPFVAARRLVEAGVPLVTLRPGYWDHHGGPELGDIFSSYRTALPAIDRSLAALLIDLEERGLANDVAVIVLGEFGRGPRVNEGGGRDHWADAGCALFAGAGMRTGQVIGETDARAERHLGTPYTFQNIVATIYRLLGIDPAQTIPDHNGRPQYLLDDREPIRELFG